MLRQLEGPPLHTMEDEDLEGWTIAHIDDETELKGLKTLLKVPDPHNLGIGRDVREGEAYGDLELVHAWKIEKETKRIIYGGKKMQARQEIKKRALPKVETKLDSAARSLGMALDDRVNEKILLHGTKPDLVLAILQNGLNERFSGGLFGSGIYVAEDPSKIDQYCTPDAECGEVGDPDVKLLHEKLYGSERSHPGRVFYGFVVRVTLGYPVYTKDGENNADNQSESVWATKTKRELAEIPDSSPPVHYHSLVAMAGADCKVKRHREFLSFDGDRTILEYLFAYRRVPK
eukprot:TRINITY_DN22363_c0_g1_i5.p1 TRINITY_DN22363_c0_g1~~TRINITY_DN22363_c0_g1_i5.p1  ORF type:complete len:289 (-),score=62.78 TRINITY_DN22363_c0_g1_i5:263-1129(-)